MIYAVTIGLPLGLMFGGFAVHEVYLARCRRKARHRPAMLEGAGSHLTVRRDG